MLIGHYRSIAFEKQNLPTKLRQSINTTEARVRELGIILREITHPDGVIDVPEGAILIEGTRTFAVVENYDRKHGFLVTPVEVASAVDGRITIIRGLFPGDKMVVQGTASLRIEPDVISKRRETNCN